MRPVMIKGTGSALADRVVTNQDLEKVMDTSDEWIRTRTGIRERRFVNQGQGLSHLAIPAGRAALAAAGVGPEDIDMVIVGTASPDMYFPTTACLVQEGLGIGQVTAFDMNGACPGWIYGVNVAIKFIQDGSHSHVLVIGGEVPSMYVNMEDRSTAVLFGDGAGATVLGPAEGGGQSRVLAVKTAADGRLWELLHCKGGGSRMPISHTVVEEKLHYVSMAGNEVYKHAVRCMVDIAGQVLDQAGYKVDDIDWFIPHQANQRIIDAVGKRLGVPNEKVILTVHKYGNTSAATIPTALDEEVRAGRIKRGDLILSASFGAGFTWAAMLYRY